MIPFCKILELFVAILTLFLQTLFQASQSKFRVLKLYRTDHKSCTEILRILLQDTVYFQLGLQIHVILCESGSDFIFLFFIDSNPKILKGQEKKG